MDLAIKKSVVEFTLLDVDKHFPLISLHSQELLTTRYGCIQPGDIYRRVQQINIIINGRMHELKDLEKFDVH